MLGCSTRAYWRCRTGSTSSKRNSPKRERRNDVQRAVAQKGRISAPFFCVVIKHIRQKLSRADENTRLLSSPLLAQSRHAERQRECRFQRHSGPRKPPG